MAVTFFSYFPASRIVRNRFLVFKEPACGTLLQQHKQINSPCGYLTVPASSRTSLSAEEHRAGSISHGMLLFTCLLNILVEYTC